MKIYTGRGDEGKTDLWADSERVSKDAPRIEAYGTVDELIALLGHAAVHADDTVVEDVERVQNQLHVVMAQLADREAKGEKQVSGEQVDWLEDRIDAYSADLPAMTGFILPGGSDAGSRLHYARTVCRRAERRIVALATEEPVEESLLAYINRLSDLLFTLARYQNREDGSEERPVDYDQQ